MSETAPAETSTPNTYLGKDNLENLDSKIRFYNNVKEEKVHCELDAAKKTAAETKLKSCTEIQSKTDYIAKVLCYVSGKKDDEAHDPENYLYTEGEEEDSGEREGTNESLPIAWCDFLYYWLGDFAWSNAKSNGSLSGTQFLEVMRTIYEALQLFGVENNCKLLYEDTSADLNKTIFDNWKTIFDFSFDYDGIKKKLQSSKNSCDEGYYKHLEGAEKAFKAVLTHCKSKPDEDPYCKDFKFKYGENITNNPLTLEDSGTQKLEVAGKDITVHKDIKLELEYTAGYTATITAKKQQASRARAQDSATRHLLQDPRRSAPAALTEDLNLDQLSSKLMYDDFDNGYDLYKDHKGFSPIKDSLNGKLNNYPDVNKSIDDIAGAWYYVMYIMSQGKSSSGDRCNSFYYWVGGRVGEKLKEISKFQDVMKEIYEVLPKDGKAKECTNLYPNITKDQFLKMKKLYNHSQDYTTIKHKLQQNGSRCTEKLKRYMIDIYSTYDNILTECKINTHHAHCSGFEEKYKQYCSRELAKLSCSEGISTAATAAVSSILGVVGIPVTALLLYKYDLLPSGISNYFGGGGSISGRSSNRINRRKRTSGTRNWDTFTENDGSTIGSTFDSATDVSTVASTIANSTDNSTVYGARQPTSTGRGRTNNRQQQPQQQRHQRQQRNNMNEWKNRNIAYQNM